MKRILILVLLSICMGYSYGVGGQERIVLVHRQFHGKKISSQLKNKIPFLNQEIFNQGSVNRGSANHLSADNIFSLSFHPKEQNYSLFSRVTGLSIFKARFTVSWYIFTNQSEIPNSTKSILNLLNTKKPKVFTTLTYINGHWVAQADLPYSTLNYHNFVYAYIAYPNTNGVLVPLAGQSFYRDTISGIAPKQQAVSLNANMLSYWSEAGYL